jgi:hypothetical protein
VKRFFLKVFVLLAVVVGVLIVVFKLQNRDAILRLPPADLHVESLVYRAENLTGETPFLALPGDNWSRIFVYAFPTNIADKISEKGVDYFLRPENLNQRQDLQRTFNHWEQTPMGLTIGSYLSHYGYGIELDKDIEQMINDAMTNAGSYYSFGRAGLVIVIPNRQRVVWALAR